MEKTTYKEIFQNKVNQVILGNPDKDGSAKLHIGGEDTFAYFNPSKIPHLPAIAYEVWDVFPQEWPQPLRDYYGDLLNDPVAWAAECADKYHADLILLRLAGIDPERGGKTIQDLLPLIHRIKERIDVPLGIIGCNDVEKDNEILPKISAEFKNESLLLGIATQDNYKTLAVSCIADSHCIIAQSPIDVNIAKQLNILISDMGLPLEKIVIDPTVGALGYGLEYSFSIMERIRLAALSGDKMLSCPFICFIGQESWRAKEAYVEESSWGEREKRGVLWEATTAMVLALAGANIVVMRHPEAATLTKNTITQLMK